MIKQLKHHNLTNTIIGSQHELIWENYNDFLNDKNLFSDIVIFYFTEMMMRRELFFSKN